MEEIMIFIEHEGALYRGKSRAWPEEVYRKGEGFVPYACAKAKPPEWGEVIDEAAAAKLMR